MRAKKIKTRIRQDQIARAALTVIGRHGLRGLNMARVAREVGVVPSGLYRHYPGKDSVLDAVLNLIAGRLEINVAQARAEGGNALEQLHELLRRHVDLICHNSAIPRLVFSEELLHNRPAQRGRIYAIIRSYLRQIEQLICEGQQQGCIGAGIDPEAASVLFLGLIQPSVILWTMSGGRFDLRGHAEAGWKLFTAVLGERAVPSGM